jgi:hypothetical protein
MNAARYSNEVGFAEPTFAGTLPFNDQATDQALVSALPGWEIYRRLKRL